jgi:hypothetical protein
MSNYKSALKRILNANTDADIDRVWRGLVNVHAIGHLTDNELMKLDLKICDRITYLMKL